MTPMTSEELQHLKKTLRVIEICSMCGEKTDEAIDYNDGWLCPECVTDLGSYNEPRVFNFK